MGMYSSPPPPPPPPDYTKNREAFKTGENARRAELASDYNTKVNDYNDKLIDFGSRLDSMGQSFEGANINNIGDMGDWRTDLQGLRNDLLRYDFEEAAPNMPSMVSSYGEMVSLDTPTLMKIDSGYRNTLLDDIGGMFDRYGGLIDQREAALQKDNQFRNTMNTSLSNLWNTAGGADIYGNGVLDSLSNRFSDLQNQFGGYQSDLMGASFGGVQSGLDSFNDWLGQQRAAYGAEESRVNDYRTGLKNDFMDFAEQLGSLGIEDLDQINALDEEVAMRAREAMNFNSPIGADFSSMISQFGNLDTQIDALRNKREAEDRRISQAGKGFSTSVQDLLSDAPEANLYAGSQFDNLRNRIGDLRTQMSNFDSPLSADFSAQLADLASAEDLLDSRYQERRNAIGDIVGGAEAARNEAMGLDLWDEAGMRGGLDKINEALLGLNRYTGGIVDQDRQQIEALAESLRGRLGELDTYRGGIEGRAQDLLQQAQDTNYYGFEDVDKMQAMYDALLQEQEQYGALQSMDELDALSQLLGGQRSRLERDAEEAAGRAEREAYEAQNTVFGMDREYIKQQLENTTLTPEEYASLVTRVQEQDPELAQWIIQQYGDLFGG